VPADPPESDAPEPGAPEPGAPEPGAPEPRPSEPAASEPAAPEPVPADRGVVDRIVDGHTAVVLVGPEEDELHVPVDALPAGAEPSSWVVLDLEVEPPAITAVDHDRTEARARDVEDRLARVRERRGGGRFGR
jgi:hypothetical protein